MDAVKVLLSYLTVVSVFSDASPDVEWPESFRSFAAALEILQASMNIFAPSCVSDDLRIDYFGGFVSAVGFACGRLTSRVAVERDASAHARPFLLNHSSSQLESLVCKTF